MYKYLHINGVRIAVIQHKAQSRTAKKLFVHARERRRGVTLRAPACPTRIGLPAGRTQGDAPTPFPLKDVDPTKTGTLVLLHGFTGSASNWVPLFDQLALPDMQIIAIDMLGHGQSSAPEDPARYAMHYCQADIIATLQALGVNAGEAILLGYSMGGRIALYTAFASFFRALILESASPGLADPVERVQRQLSDNALADSIEQEGIAAFVERWEQLPLFTSQRDLPASTKRALHLQRLRNQPRGLANSLRGVGTGAQPSLHTRLPKLTIPVLLLAGERDTKFCAIAHEMQQQLPHATLDIVPNAGHAIHLEQPELFAQQVKQFCACS